MQPVYIPKHGGEASINARKPPAKNKRHLYFYKCLSAKINLAITQLFNHSEIIHHHSASHFYSVLGRVFGSHLLHAYGDGHAWETSSSAWTYMGYLCLPFLSVALPHLYNYNTILGGECQHLFGIFWLTLPLQASPWVALLSRPSFGGDLWRVLGLSTSQDTRYSRINSVDFS